MDDFEKLRAAARALTPDQKQQIFADIRDGVLIHPLERQFHVNAEIILEAIHRAPDITQRGVRGLIAELTFVIDIMPKMEAEGWKNDPPIGEQAYDARLKKGNQSIRIQVKTQRRAKGVAMQRRNGFHVVEVQRTRTGTDGEGQATRPYRFDEFDLLAVCMQASTGSWHSFMYIPSKSLKPKRKAPEQINTMQAIPAFGDDGVWSNDLATALGRVNDAVEAAAGDAPMLSFE
ncbi:hypothetical protein [Bradyrhizobium sp.]|uniref:hypothetical protein n=1 Tax=Bradyrhizobium sp. TaxID=376 RepID=UPI001DB96808|nr:hypothetical protein [Bradyrhizobium sp.]MBI5320887.1 hypothetical protein [Bradyrhizobium sp.]